MYIERLKLPTRRLHKKSTSVSISRRRHILSGKLHLYAPKQRLLSPRLASSSHFLYQLVRPHSSSASKPHSLAHLLTRSSGLSQHINAAPRSLVASLATPSLA